MKNLIITFFAIIFTVSISVGNCLLKENESIFKDDFQEELKGKQLDTLLEGEQVEIDFYLEDDEGRPEFDGSLVALKRKGSIEFYQIGEWKIYSEGKLLGAYEFDSCGLSIHEEYYENLDSVKTSEVTRRHIEYKGKTYVMEVIENFSPLEQTYDEFVIVKGKRKHHGTSRTVQSGKVIYERTYIWGKVVK